MESTELVIDEAVEEVDETLIEEDDILVEEVSIDGMCGVY
ncbi:MAG: mycofactocin precursor MftA [Actinobacteria bacterium]|nr:mycofactocin precursor MftA [Actinomycetota bacterium]